MASLELYRARDLPVSPAVERPGGYSWFWRELKDGFHYAVTRHRIHLKSGKSVDVPFERYFTRLDNYLNTSFVVDVGSDTEARVTRRALKGKDQGSFGNQRRKDMHSERGCLIFALDISIFTVYFVCLSG
jgi:hypothetical protein